MDKPVHKKKLAINKNAGFATMQKKELSNDAEPAQPWKSIRLF